MEINCVMNVKDKVRKKDDEEDISPSRLPRNFICIDPSQRQLVFEYLSSFDQGIKEPALFHLRLCLHCREVAEVVLKINKSLGPKTGRRLHGENSEVKAEAEGILCAEAVGAELGAEDDEGEKEADFASNSPA